MKSPDGKPMPLHCKIFEGNSVVQPLQNTINEWLTRRQQNGHIAIYQPVALDGNLVLFYHAEVEVSE